MQIVKCGMDDIDELTILNKQLIEAERSNNSMSIEELRNRMTDFLSGVYEAFRLLLQYLGVKSLELEVLPWNEQGIRFWSSLGFREVSRYMRLET